MTQSKLVDLFQGERHKAMSMLCLACSFLFSNNIQSQERSDTAARAAIFADQHAMESEVYLQDNTRDLSPEDRCRELSKWVLPNDHHPNLRLDVDFFPLSVANSDETSSLPSQDLSRLDSQIVSPIYLLVDSAAQSGKLDELRSRIVPPPHETNESRINRLAILSLINLSSNDRKASGQSMEEFFGIVLQEERLTEHTKKAALLVAARTNDDPQLREIAAEALGRIVPSYLEDFHRTSLNRHISALAGRYHHLDAAENKSSVGSNQWHATSAETAATRGRGYPMARWHMAPGVIANAASHDNDFLYFNTPLRGDFEVECDMTFFDWNESSLLFAGQWIAPVYDRSFYDIGDLHGYRRKPLDPLLAKSGEWSHYRLVVRDQRIQWFFNGRSMHAQPLSKEHDPWLAIQSTARKDGSLKNLRISGSPTIPDLVSFCDAETLSSWIPYHFDAEYSAFDDWKSYMDEANKAGIHGRHRTDLPRGSNCERAIFYHRPMIEDGSLEYEFFYDPAKSQAHPALDRLAFLLAPEGVQVHWITDGVFDRTGRDPGAREDEPSNRRGESPLPLRANDWNTMQLKIQGDVAALTLNHQLIYERILDTSNSRKFGLFYYCDQGDLRVRNIVYRGAWPKMLPEVTQQELAGEACDFLDARLGELTNVFEHDFASQGFPTSRFNVIEGDSSHIQVQSDGLQIHRPGTGGYRNVRIAASISVQGDYDVTATFEQLLSDPVPDGSGSISLMTATRQPSSEECGISRKVQNPKREDTHFMQCVRIQDADKKEKRFYFGKGPCEAMAGTLRLARRGDQIYFLLADNDSSYFRLIAQETCTRDDLLSNAVQLMAQIHGAGGATSVVWKKLVVRAEKLSGPAIGEDQSSLATLNQQRDALPKHFVHDLTASAPSFVLTRWSDSRAWKASDDGFPIEAKGQEFFSSSGAALSKQLNGDFDLEVQFVPQHLDTPVAGKHGEVVFQVFLNNAEKSQANLHFRKYDDGRTEVCAYSKYVGENGKSIYNRLGASDASIVTHLRLARRGKIFYFLATSPDFNGERLIAQTPLDDVTIQPLATRLYVQVGGKNLTYKILLKSIRVHAQQMRP